MRRHCLNQLVRIVAAALLALLAVLPLAASAQDVPAADQVTGPVQLQLDVSINGVPAGMISNFVDQGDGRLAATARELNELRIKTPAGYKPDDLVPLDGIKGVSYLYDEPKQAIAFQMGDDNRIRSKYDARGELNQAAVTPSNYGAVLNYSLFGSAGGESTVSNLRSADFSGLNATLDARLMSPLGVLNQTAIVGMTLAEETSTLRLDTTYTYSDDKYLTRWQAGDFISGGTTWSRPVRMAGVQAQRNFSMRPDLVKNPLPAVSGSAAVPSSVDVYVNGIKSFSKDVAAGPYQIDNIPVVTGPGVAQVVTRDASGRETVQAVSFYNSPQLLKPGLLDFSVESGVTRSRYGIESNDYDTSLVGIATLRRGITDWMTVEAHGEVGEGLVNGGAGAVVRAFNRGVVTGAASVSSTSEGNGIQLYGGFETRVGPVSINARSQHALGDYQDLASLTAFNDADQLHSSPVALAGGLFNYAPPRSVDSITLSAPIAYDKSTISATYLRYDTSRDGLTELLTATYARPLVNTANMYATAYVDLNKTDEAGLYVGVSMSLNNNVSVNGGLNARGGDIGSHLSANKSLDQQPGSWGWRITDNESTSPYRAASASYRAESARLEAGVTQYDQSVRASASVEGAVAVIGGDVYTSGRIEDSFAVVDVHAPGVKVERENLLVGTTNSKGKILIPNLGSYQKNKIAIDPMDLPLNAEPATTYEYVRPSFRSGLYVDFDVKKASPSAIVILKGADGQFLPVGSEVHVDGSGETYVVGYDGQTFIKDLKPVNIIHVTSDKGTCSAQFTFKASSDVQPTIGPEICQ